MRSVEWPDLVFVEPAAWNAGRPYGRPLWIVVHTTEGSEGLRSAEDGAAYDARREDGTSTHYFHDQDTTVQSVYTHDRANAAKGTGNKYGIHHELCGKAAQNPAQWDDAASAGTLARFARQAARDAAKWDIPVRHLTVAQVRNFESGFCAHSDISAAFGESTHTDPGSNYPWTDTLNAVRAIMAPPTEEDPLAAFTREELIDMMEQAVVNLYVRGLHAQKQDDVYAGYDTATKKQANAVRDFIMNPDLIPTSSAENPQERPYTVLAQIAQDVADLKAGGQTTA